MLIQINVQKFFFFLRTFLFTFGAVVQSKYGPEVKPVKILHNIWNDCFFLFPDGTESTLEFEFDSTHAVLTLRKPAVNAAADWTVLLR